MKINRQQFYTVFRIKFGKLLNKHVAGIEAIFDEWEQEGLQDLRMLAYMLATAWHETGFTMQPVTEIGKGQKRPYGKKIKHSGVAYVAPNKYYYGRGLVQITWFENYQLLGRLIGIDLLANPDLALQLPIAVKIMFEGMLRGSSNFGDFTGKCLEMYFNAKTNDPLNARRIINGTDCASKIKEYHDDFMECLTKKAA